MIRDYKVFQDGPLAVAPAPYSISQLAKKGSHTKLVIKLAEHSGTGLVVVEGGVERDANDIKTMIQVIQVQGVTKSF